MTVYADGYKHPPAQTTQCGRWACRSVFAKHAEDGTCPDGKAKFVRYSKGRKISRASNSFSRSEISTGATLFRMLLSGEDTRQVVRTKAKEVGALLKSFQGMERTVAKHVALREELKEEKQRLARLAKV